MFGLEIFTAATTAKWFAVWVNQMMRSQIRFSTETLWTFAANIRLHNFMILKWVLLQFTTCNELLLTNVTREPSTFIMWLQQMILQLAKPSKTVWTVSTCVRLCISVNTNMTLQFIVYLKQLPTVWTVIWSSVAVYITFMLPQGAELAKTFVTHWALVWFVSGVDSHVTV